MDELTEARRAALRRFIDSEGGYGKVAAKYGLTPSHMSYLSQLIAKGSSAPLGERSARNWQKRLQIEGDPILHPPLEPQGAAATLPLQTVIDRLAEFLQAVPSDQREVIASVIGAFARRPLPELGAALVTLLDGGSGDKNWND
ncbi:hypothetical protein M2282_003684 [Variovorax boronicumulans]|uniref:hypothetical protein n=1 Tax=Variovorax boronicumulans TaxID=436515 RepID=UPI002474B87D|nr:hypothetical protein [Variovorax boronicumulans]MDH6168531.1 hypothetical protein [Variovorax boronicumulans]